MKGTAQRHSTVNGHDVVVPGEAKAPHTSTDLKFSVRDTTHHTRSSRLTH